MRAQPVSTRNHFPKAIPRLRAAPHRSPGGWSPKKWVARSSSSSTGGTEPRGYSRASSTTTGVRLLARREQALEVEPRPGLQLL